MLTDKIFSEQEVASVISNFSDLFTEDKIEEICKNLTPDELKKVLSINSFTDAKQILEDIGNKVINFVPDNLLDQVKVIADKVDTSNWNDIKNLIGSSALKNVVGGVLGSN